jgi:hypothetical protein
MRYIIWPWLTVREMSAEQSGAESNHYWRIDMNTMKLALILLAALFLAVQVTRCASQSAPRFPLMFEISTRPWLYGLSQKYGYNITLLSDIPVQEFKAIKSAGFDVVWMMGVWQLGEHNYFLKRRKNGAHA